MKSTPMSIAQYRSRLGYQPIEDLNSTTQIHILEDRKSQAILRLEALNQEKKDLEKVIQEFTLKIACLKHAS